MSGQLQVRQMMRTPNPLSGDVIHVTGQPGAWHDVPSPGWLFGFVLPGSGMVYEFRNAPEGD